MQCALYLKNKACWSQTDNKKLLFLMPFYFFLITYTCFFTASWQIDRQLAEIKKKKVPENKFHGQEFKCKLFHKKEYTNV